MAGCAGRRAWRPIRFIGGARSTDEVTVHSSVTAMNSAGEPSGASTGSEPKAAADTSVTPTSQGPSRACSASTRSEATPQA